MAGLYLGGRGANLQFGELESTPPTPWLATSLSATVTKL